MTKTFAKCISVSGGLCSSFVFEGVQEKDEWLASELPKLEEKYGKLVVSTRDLPALKVGDKCRVFGEGDDVFVIEGLREYSKNRFGFMLDSGWNEEVAKCYSAV